MISTKKADSALYKKTWKQAIKRDDGLCVLCGYRASEVHHIVFRSQGGTSELSNLACLCQECHRAAHGVMAKEIRKRLKGAIK